MINQSEKPKQTQFGTLYAPQPTWLQMLILIGAFFGGFVVAKGVIWRLGGLSDAAQTGLYVAFAAVLVLGYALWMARLRAIVFHGISKGLLTALFKLIVRRQKPDSLEDLLPSEEKLTKMAVGAQKAASAFTIAGIIVSAIAAPISLLIAADAAAAARVVTIAVALIVWGTALAFLGRRGYLPILEEGEH